MAKSPKAPTKAPQQVPPQTGEGQVAKTGATFGQSPGRKPNPPSTQVKKISNQPQPPRKGPVNAGAAGGQQQQGG